MSFGFFWQVFFQQPKASLNGSELAPPGQGVVQGRHDGECFRLQSQRKKAVSLLMTATDFLR